MCIILSTDTQVLKAIPDVCTGTLQTDGEIYFEIARQLVGLGNRFLMCVSRIFYLIIFLIKSHRVYYYHLH